LRLAPQVDSLCVHSDSRAAANLALAARAALVSAGYEVGP
jgi:lactam utilization protein B